MTPYKPGLSRRSELTAIGQSHAYAINGSLRKTYADQSKRILWAYHARQAVTYPTTLLLTKLGSPAKRPTSNRPTIRRHNTAVS